MCGIAGAIHRSPLDDKRIAATFAAMKNRGPDGSGVHRGTLGGFSVTLLHTRLAIIDLDPRANQPFIRGNLVLIYNGEIYNYVELRAELEGLGHRFTTTSDTEVIVEAWREWGKASFDRFEGMWAFALLDTAKDRLILSRDRFGEKPLYFMRHDGALYFASEVKFLEALSGHRPAANLRQVRRYLVNGYKSLYKGQDTFFDGVGALPASTFAEMAGPDLPMPRRYWRLEYAPQAMSAPDAADGVRARLTRAVEIRLRADVPVAFCLSGGIDSGTLAALAVKHFGARLHAFSIIDGDARYNESANIATVVEDLGCEHHIVHTSTEGFLDRLDAQIAYHDAPVATITYYLHAFLSQAIAARGYKVAISGTAADELFTGYYDHYAFWLAEQRDRNDFPHVLDEWRKSYGAFVQNPLLQDPLRFVAEPCARDHIFLNADFFSSLLRDPFDEPFAEAAYSGNLLRNRMLNELQHESIPVILGEDDMNSMEYSIENRSPYLDRDLAEFAYRIPNAHLIRDGFVKWPLREAGAGSLHDRVRLDRRKRGFNASIESLLDRRDPRVRERLLAPGPIFDVVDRKRFLEFFDADMTDNSFSKFLFSFVSARLFLDRRAAA